MPHDPPFPEQRSLFETDPVSDLARRYLDFAWDVIQRRKWLDDKGITNQMGELAIAKNRLDLDCLRVEKLSRGIQPPKRAYRTRRVAATAK